MLPSSKLLPLTIAGIAGILSIKAYALATTVPSRAAVQDGIERMTAVASAASGFISQAHASSGSTPAANQTAAPASRTPAEAVSAPPSPPVPARSGGLGTAGPPTPPAPPAGAAATAAIPPTTGAGEQSPPAAASMTGSASELPAPYRDRTEERERQLAQREATMAAAEKRLNERLAELVSLQQRMQGLESALKERDEANWTGLVKMYEGMKPRDAAALFNTLDKPVLLEIVDRMKPAKASPVIAAMDPERARQMTADLAAKRTKSTTTIN